MNLLKGYGFSLFTIIALDLFFQAIHIIYFVYDFNSSGSVINNFMILFVLVTYICSILIGKSKMNRFQFVISSIILISLHNTLDDIESVNVFFMIAYLIFNFLGIYDVFYLKKDFGESIFDFILYKNWFS